jgi:hypothetical protein
VTHAPGTNETLRAEVARLDRTLRRLEEEIARARVEEPVITAVQSAAAVDVDDLFDRHVELDAGPFADFDELSAFETALAALPEIAEVYVRRFFDGRAIVELETTEELPLVAVLRRALAPAFAVEYAERAALKITLVAPLARSA